MELKLRRLFLDVSTSIASCNGLHGLSPSNSRASRPESTDSRAAIASSRFKKSENSAGGLEYDAQALSADSTSFARLATSSAAKISLTDTHRPLSRSREAILIAFSESTPDD